MDSLEDTIGDDSSVVSGFCMLNPFMCKGGENLRTHHATSISSVFPMTELGSGGAKIQLGELAPRSGLMKR